MAEMTTVQPQAQAPAPAPAPAQGKPPLKKKGAQKKKMAKRLIALAVAAAVCLGGGFALHRFLNSGSGDLGEIYAQPASIGSIQSTVSGSGTAKAKESAAITLTQSGTVQEQNVLTQLPDSEPVTFDIIQNAVLALDSGKVDAVSVSIANGEMFVSTNPKLAVSTVQFDNSQNGNVIGFPKGETELVDAVNKIIDEVLEQGLYDQWLEEATVEAENLGL